MRNIHQYNLKEAALLQLVAQLNQMRKTGSYTKLQMSSANRLGFAEVKQHCHRYFKQKVPYPWTKIFLKNLS